MSGSSGAGRQKFSFIMPSISAACFHHLVCQYSVAHQIFENQNFVHSNRISNFPIRKFPNFFDLIERINSESKKNLSNSLYWNIQFSFSSNPGPLPRPIVHGMRPLQAFEVTKARGRPRLLLSISDSTVSNLTLRSWIEPESVMATQLCSRRGKKVRFSKGSILENFGLHFVRNF